MFTRFPRTTLYVFALILALSAAGQCAKIATHFFYWYDAPSGNVDTRKMPYTPPGITSKYNFDGTNSAYYSLKDYNWYVWQIKDMQQAGIDYILPVSWGDGGTYKQSELWRLRDAIINTGSNLKVGIYDDTTSEAAEWNSAHGFGYQASQTDNNLKPSLGAWDLADYFYDKKIKTFFQIFPQTMWATHNGQPVSNGGRPLILTYVCRYFKDYQYADDLWLEVRNRFKRDFKDSNGNAIDPFLVLCWTWYNETGNSAINSVGDGETVYGGANGGNQLYNFKGYKTANLGPGCDTRKIGRTDYKPRWTDADGIDDGQDDQWLRDSFKKTSSDCNLIVLESWNELWEGTSLGRCTNFPAKAGGFLSPTYYMDKLKELVTWINPPAPLLFSVQPRVPRITASEATITWQTSIPADSRIDYGNSTYYGTVVTDATLTTKHSITLTGLLSGTLYCFKVTSSAPGYTAISTVSNMTFWDGAQPGGPSNFSFESYSLSTWMAYGDIDGVVSGPWLNGMAAHNGTYMVGGGALNAAENGGVYQRLSTVNGYYYAFKCWMNTWVKDGDSSNSGARIGIDPTGGTDPSSTSVVWTPFTSTQGTWTQLSVCALAKASSITVFCDGRQAQPMPENAFAFDDALLTVVAKKGKLGLMKQQSNNTEIGLSNMLVSSAYGQTGQFVYVQEDDRSSGVRVVTTTPCPVGTTLNVSGKFDIKDGERYLIPTALGIVSAPSNDPKPLAMTTSAMGGDALNTSTPGVFQGVGLNNLGLLVRLCGQVTHSEPGFFYIDDGAGRTDGSVYPGVKVIYTGTVSPSEGSLVIVTGISSTELSGVTAMPVIRTRTDLDVIVF